MEAEECNLLTPVFRESCGCVMEHRVLQVELDVQ